MSVKLNADCEDEASELKAALSEKGLDMPESSGDRVELARLGAELPLLMDMGESRAEEPVSLDCRS